jgi:hypothetical protein
LWEIVETEVAICACISVGDESRAKVHASSKAPCDEPSVGIMAFAVALNRASTSERSQKSGRALAFNAVALGCVYTVKAYHLARHAQRIAVNNDCMSPQCLCPSRLGEQDDSNQDERANHCRMIPSLHLKRS